MRHLPEITLASGVTVPADFCFHCHAGIAEERPSHREFAFDGCAAAGCHNYHDNRALNGDFLLEHLREPATRKDAVVPLRDLAGLVERAGAAPRRALSAGDADGPAGEPVPPELLEEWASTAHAQGGVNCSDCHLLAEPATSAPGWSNHPAHPPCVKCHEEEGRGFFAGRHGMRTGLDLPAMTPGAARLPMKPKEAHRELTCTSCHPAHSFDTRQAAVEACLGCHDDAHSLAYRRSPHFAAWEAEGSGQAKPGSGVSCATCHLPREVRTRAGHAEVKVQHNQNATLRPVEKMIRPACLHCHGLGLAIDALADRALSQENFDRPPSTRIETLDLAARRSAERVKHPRSTLEVDP